MTGAFAQWQPRYAAHGVATFPVELVDNDKKPMTTGYQRVGARGSEQLAMKFPHAEMLGFMCGRRNKITVLDMDLTDESILREGERVFGPSPLIWRTGGDKFAAAFRHNGEGRRIRPIPGLPIDLLGGGFCVAPPSAGAKRRYEIIRGSLDDLDRLPTARIPDEIAREMSKVAAKRAANGNERKILEGKRNVELFKYARGIVDHCDTLDQLLDAARTWCDGRLARPLPDAEIVKTCNSVWTYRGGRKRVMNLIVEPDRFRALASSPEIFGVFAFMAAENGPNAVFMFADGLGEAMGWPRRLVPAARSRFLELGVIECVRRRRPGSPALYRWAGVETEQPASHQTAARSSPPAPRAARGR